MAEKKITYEEFQTHQQRENLWILLHGKGLLGFSFLLTRHFFRLKRKNKLLIKLNSL